MIVHNCPMKSNFGQNQCEYLYKLITGDYDGLPIERRGLIFVLSYSATIWHTHEEQEYLLRMIRSGP